MIFSLLWETSFKKGPITFKNHPILLKKIIKSFKKRENHLKMS